MSDEREWDDALAERARKLAGDVIAQSGYEAARPEINRGEWDADDHVIIAMRATMQTARAEALLREALNALNLIPNRRLNVGPSENTYVLAGKIDRYFEEVKNG